MHANVASRTEKKPKNTDDFKETGELDGLRVMKAMSRARAVHRNQEANPVKTCESYLAQWEHTLNAEGKPWNWTDVSRFIGMGKHRSMMRMFIGIGNVEKLLKEWKPKQARLASAQLLKCIHQFVLDGNRRMEWKLIHLPDPLFRPKSGVSELELEAILGELQIEDSMQKRTKSAVGGAGGEKED